MENNGDTALDLTDLTSFNKNLGTSRGVASIGLRNTKNLFEKTDHIVRAILSEADHLTDNSTPKEYYRLGKLYGCSLDGIKTIQQNISSSSSSSSSPSFSSAFLSSSTTTATAASRKSNQNLFKYKPSDWENVKLKLWNSHLFKDFGVQRFEEYQQQTITLSKLQSLFEYILQIKLTQKEVAALVSEMRCITIKFGETIIQYPLLMTELKLFGNAARSSESSQQLQQQLFHQQQQQLHKNEEKEQSILSTNTLAQQLKDLSIDCSLLYTALRSISNGCIQAWKKEKSYFIQLLHEIPTGTLDSESFREFLSYNINTKLSSIETQLLIYYFNGSLHRFTNMISLSDLVKDMKLLALQMPSAILAPPSENSSSSSSSSSTSSSTLVSNTATERWYDHWCQAKVASIENYFHNESQRILRINEHQNTSSGIGSHLNRLKRRNNNHHLLNRLKIQQEEGSDDDEGGEGGDHSDDDDITISTIGMESVHSSSISASKLKLKPVSKNKNETILKRQSSNTSSVSSSSSTFLSPIKHKNHHPISNSSSASVASFTSSSTSSSSVTARPLVDIQGKVKSIHYNLASPHIYSTEALKERNKLLKQIELQAKGEDESTAEGSETKSSSLKALIGKKNGGLSFALGASIIMRAHNVKSKLAEENEELISDELALKNRQEGTENSHTTRMGLPTQLGYYETTRGSTILRAKTPMYLIRPVNGSDSVLALSHGKGLGGKKNGGNFDSDDSASVTSLKSIQSNKSTRSRKKRNEDIRIQNTIRSELECGSLDEKGLGLRYDLRYQEVGELVRCLKLSSKQCLDDIIVSLWNEVQLRMGKGLNPLSESGVVIERTYFVQTLHEVFPLFSESHCQCLFSSFDPTRRGYIPCHVIHSLVSVSMIKQGSSIQHILLACFRGVVWEYLNTNRDLREVLKHLISPLSTLNNKYSTRKEEYEQNNQNKQDTNHSIKSPPPPPPPLSQPGGGQYSYYMTLEEQQLEKDILSLTYLPAHIISNCLRNICTNDVIEKILINKLDQFYHTVLNKNIRLVDNNSDESKEITLRRQLSSQGLSLGSDSTMPCNPEEIRLKYEHLMRPKQLTDVRIKDLFDFFSEGNVNNNECAKIIILEQKKLSKKLNKYLYKTMEKEQL